jgi:hypothetical protein
VSVLQGQQAQGGGDDGGVRSVADTGQQHGMATQGAAVRGAMTAPMNQEDLAPRSVVSGAVLFRTLGAHCAQCARVAMPRKTGNQHRNKRSPRRVPRHWAGS